jgi:hypothetical protein
MSTGSSDSHERVVATTEFPKVTVEVRSWTWIIEVLDKDSFSEALDGFGS